ncbi:MAG: hypothetical protein AAFQ94_01720 [Bacteroidota bacterium]
MTQNNTLLTILLMIVSLFLVSCNEEETPDSSSLRSYIDQTGFEVQKDSLIACAASGQTGFLAGDSSKAVSILYYPLSEISDVRYFESTNTDVEALEFYEEKQLTNSQLFSGTLRRFNREMTNTNTTAIVTFIRNSKVFISNPISLKQDASPTVFSSNVMISQSDKLMPEFDWSDNVSDGDAIYFQVISEVNDNLLTGTYTFEPKFQFYQLDNVVLNITTIETPTLQANETYNFTVMGVSEDNWVNFIVEDSFVAQ